MEFSLIDYQSKMEGHKVFLYYKGPFDEIILNKIGTYLRYKFPASPRACGKLFSIFIELAQNISYYSAETEIYDDSEKRHGIGTIAILDAGEKFKLISGNLVENDIVDDIVSKIEKINQLDHEGLRQLKKEVRSSPRKEGHKGGNIGLIQIAIKSENPLEVETKPYDAQHSFITLTTYINKDIEETSETTSSHA
ncbi:MAG: SiaB family protein kinase [Cytophagales bacterium]|nr:SiaB family protein kinase [Cytophagales bacterium]MDW8384966.1 SiaB family protein kinase [Flammeovirgaceae bacterium]